MVRRTIPRHEAVERHLRSRVAGLQPGDPIESDAELCDLFQVSRMTVRQATQRLVAEGLIYRVSGVGTFVGHPQVHRDMGHLRSFTEEMRLRGLVVGSTVIAAEIRRGTKPEIAALGLAPNSKVVHIKRLRRANDEPMAIESAVLPPHFDWLLTTDLASGSLHSLLSEHGYHPARAVGTQIAALATKEDAVLLDLPPRDAIFVENRLITAEDGSLIEFTESRYAGSRFVFHIELVDMRTNGSVPPGSEPRVSPRPDGEQPRGAPVEENGGPILMGTRAMD